MTFNAKCVECGRYLGANDYVLGLCDYEPLSEFGRERIEWTCRRCAAVPNKESGDAHTLPSPSKG